MGRVGIVTLGGSTNFGNRLQNYALQEAIGSLGHEAVETLHGLPRGEERLTKVRRRLFAVREGRRLQRPHWSGPLSPARHVDVHVCPPERQQAISDFVDSHIRSADRAFGAVPAAELASAYDHFVVGSDQVWNPAFTHGNEEWFLDFAGLDQRVAYAASFGISKAPSYLAARYRRGLAGIPHLSVREYAGASIVQDLTGEAPPVVLDPTLLIPSPAWGELAVVPSALDGRRYVLLFLLARGDREGASFIDLSTIERHARQNELELIDMNGPRELGALAWSPLEFIGAIMNAELVITDSFHAVVFAHVFHRPFLITERGNMNSRFETLLEHSGIKGVLFSQVQSLDRARDIDWTWVNARIEERRRTSLEFLRHALGSQ